MQISHILCTLALAQVLTLTCAFAAGRVHVIALGKWQLVKVEDDATGQLLDVRIRALSVDAKVKEYTVGQFHDVTDRIFVVARVFRLNDQLPEESQPKWTWQRGGWIEVDRVSGHVTPLNLPNFNPHQSIVSWYRDYAAYCAASADDNRVYAIVMQLGMRKPIVRRQLGDIPISAGMDPPCDAPVWQRRPTRVSFSIMNGGKWSFSISGHGSEIATSNQDETE